MKSARVEATTIAHWLNIEQLRPAAVISDIGASIVLDLSAGSVALGQSLDGLDVQRFSELVDAFMQRNNATRAYGRWGEHRALYNNDNFAGNGEERRTVHMGIDVFCAAGTPVCTPLDGVVEIVANNTAELDYGPLLVIRHATPEGEPFFTLYGHLGPECLATCVPGQRLTAGQSIATVGAPPGNGNWPPHLHFQLVLDLLGLGKDFPGVACASEQAYWLGLSPNPACFFPAVSAVALDGRKKQ